MLKVNHHFQAQGDVINECREDEKKKKPPLALESDNFDVKKQAFT